jgi:hypothetical protein
MGGSPYRPLAQQFALGIALAGLVLVFVGALLLVFPPPAVANSGLQGEILYDLLGCLEYKDSGHFEQTDDLSMQVKLKRLAAEYHLNGREGSAYIQNLASHAVVWSVPGLPLVFNSQSASDSYEMQYLSSGDYRLFVQNFWVAEQAGRREEFRMVVALLVK